MKYLVILCFALNCFAGDYSKAYKEIHGNGTYTHEQLTEANRLLKKIEPQVNELEKLSVLSNTAIRAMVKIGTRNLRRKGFTKTARRIERQWRRLDGTIIQIARHERNIGDFEPLSEWLDTTYETFEQVLGLEVCGILRLTDIKTFNYGLRVVFRPCVYGEEEFSKHFIADERYKGVAPVASYWAVVLGCSIGTYSIGYFFICSPIGIVVEAAVKNKVAPWAAPKIYEKACLYGYSL